MRRSIGDRFSGLSLNSPKFAHLLRDADAVYFAKFYDLVE